jgi:uncharacterized OsmC-like protein
VDINRARARQKELREQYIADAATALTPIAAHGNLVGDRITATIATWSGATRAGLHPATGGDGSDACSGDMLLEALLGCAGVTFRSVAAAMQLDLGTVELHAESTFDARGTLGIDRTVEVGIGPVTVTVTVDTELEDQTRERLAASVERYCVVGQSLRQHPTYRVVTRSRTTSST